MAEIDPRLRRIIEESEDHRIDFKSADKLEDKEGIAKHLVTIANREGGQLVFDVSDDGEIEGKEILENIRSGLVSKIARTRCSPPVVVSHSFFSDQSGVNGPGDVLVIDISARRDVPHAVIERDNGLIRKYYIRTGNESRPIETSQEIEQLYSGEVDPNSNDRYRIRFNLEYPSFEPADIYPVAPTTRLYHRVFQLFSESDKEELTLDLFIEELGPISYFTDDSDELEPLTRFICQLSPFLALYSMQSWTAEYSEGTRTRNEDGERILKSKFNLKPVKSYKLPDGPPPAIDDLDIEFEEIDHLFGETSNLIPPDNTDIIISYPNGHGELRSSKRDSFDFLIRFSPPRNVLETGLPSDFPGYLKTDLEELILSPIVSTDVYLKYVYPDERDPNLKSHVELGQQLSERIEKLNWGEFCSDLSSSEIFRISRKLEDIEKKLD